MADEHPTYWAGDIETATPDELRVYHEAKLRPLVDWLYERCPYWTKKFDEVGAGPGDIVTLEDLAKLPYITKAEYAANMDAMPPYGEFLCYPEDEIHRAGAIVYRTTGTTGKQRWFINTNEGFQHFGNQALRVLWAGGVRPGDMYMTTFPLSLWAAAWGFDYGARPQNMTLLPAGPPYDTRARLDCIVDYRPAAVATTPSYALTMADAAVEHGIDLADCGVRSVIVGGEPFPPSRRRTIEEAWGVPGGTIDFAGITEGGPLHMSCECSAQAGMHLFEDVAIFEVIEPGGTKPVPAGELGELVFTSMHQRVMGTSFHYRTGDLVQYADDQCSCGRWFRRIQGIHGRIDDMVKIRGVNIFPSAVEDLIRKTPGLADDFMMVVTRANNSDEVTVEVEPAAGLEAQQRADAGSELEDSLRRLLSIRIPVRVVDRETLPRFELKAQRWDDRRPKAD